LILSGVSSASIGLIGATCIILWEAANKTAAETRWSFPFALTIHTVFEVPASAVVFLGGVVGAILHPDVADLDSSPIVLIKGFLPHLNK
jgi:chromate transport protein ChrA